MNRKLPNGRWVDAEGNYVPAPLKDQLENLVAQYRLGWPLAPAFAHETVLFAEMLLDLTNRVEKLEGK